ncbi:MAG: STT3 domain-containing protein [Candidatus Hodarchaeales archaeon]|jgi:asparagine N-glycosylation enzyme membrane subunit Stt3
MPVFVDRILNDLKNRYNTAATTINKEMIFSYSAIIIIFIVAYLVRIFVALHDPAYEIILSANDPYSQFRAATYIEENGLFAFLSWVDPQTWYPEGRFWGRNLYMGTPLSAVILHQFQLILGLDVSLEVVCFFQPAFFGALTCVAIYFLGKELGNKKVGILAALFLSVSAGHLQRTVAGFFDNEALGILFLVLLLYFYARSLRTGSVITTILSGICFGILSGSWGASSYAINLITLHAGVLVLLRKSSDRLFLSYGGSILIGYLIMILVPRNGPGALIETDILIPIGMLGIIGLVELYRYINTFIDIPQFRSKIKPFSPIFLFLIKICHCNFSICKSFYTDISIG